MFIIISQILESDIFYDLEISKIIDKLEVNLILKIMRIL
jgi:hypothetical protein